MKRISIAVVLFAISSLFFVLDWDDVFNVVVRIPIVGWIVEYNFPPSDFYVPLTSIPVCFGSHTLPFMCKYAGRYEIDIIGVDADEMERSGVEMNWHVEDVKGQRLRDGSGGGSFALASGHDMRSEYRYCYDIFFVPSDLPIKTPLRMSVECAGAIDKFVRRFPQAKIVIVKSFDK